MNSKKHKELVTQILENLGDQGTVSELLLTLTNENEATENVLMDITNKHTILTESNKVLQSANNKLWSQIGIQDKTTVEKKTEEATEESIEEAEEVIEISDLINEKGDFI